MLLQGRGREKNRIWVVFSYFPSSLKKFTYRPEERTQNHRPKPTTARRIWRDCHGFCINRFNPCVQPKLILFGKKKKDREDAIPAINSCYGYSHMIQPCNHGVANTTLCNRMPAFCHSWEFLQLFIVDLSL